jgi:hypothetical protein
MLQWADGRPDRDEIRARHRRREAHRRGDQPPVCRSGMARGDPLPPLGHRGPGARCRAAERGGRPLRPRRRRRRAGHGRRPRRAPRRLARAGQLGLGVPPRRRARARRRRQLGSAAGQRGDPGDDRAGLPSLRALASRAPGDPCHRPEARQSQSGLLQLHDEQARARRDGADAGNGLRGSLRARRSRLRPRPGRDPRQPRAIRGRGRGKPSAQPARPPHRHRRGRRGRAVPRQRSARERPDPVRGFRPAPARPAARRDVSGAMSLPTPLT